MLHLWIFIGCAPCVTLGKLPIFSWSPSNAQTEGYECSQASGPSVSRACVQHEWDLCLLLWSIHYAPPSPTQKVSLSPIFTYFFYGFSLYFSVVPTTSPLLFATATIATTVQNHGVTCAHLFHVALPSKHDRGRIRKQEGSCPVMCIWLSVCCRKQAEEMWMWSALPDWLSMLALGYKLTFPVIYRCGAVSHKASGWGRESE